MFQHQMLYGKYICIAQLQKVYASHKVATYVMYQSNPSLPIPLDTVGAFACYAYPRMWHLKANFCPGHLIDDIKGYK